MSDRADYIRYLDRRRLSANTIEKYAIHLRAFESWLGRSLVSASTADIETFLDTRAGRGGRKLNDRSRNDWISHLSCFYTWSMRANGAPVVNPTEAITRARPRRLLPRPISEADLELAMANADRTMYAFLALGAYAGFRCCEMAWLMAESVMWHEGVINVFGKGRKERIVDIHPIVASALRSFGVPAHGSVFRLSDGSRPWSPRKVSNEINWFLAGLGIEATAHQLRHRFGTKTYAACKNIRVVQELLGHANPNTTAVYTAFARDDARSAVLALPTPFTTSTDEAA